jgi:hypothetical protein
MHPGVFKTDKVPDRIEMFHFTNCDANHLQRLCLIHYDRASFVFIDTSFLSSGVWLFGKPGKRGPIAPRKRTANY